MPDTALEHLDLRHLPAVDPIDAPERYSQTLLRHANACRRSAYLYVKHHGGMPSHALDRGAALHIAQANVTKLILERYDIDSGGDVDYAVDEDTAKLMLEEAIDAHPEFTIPLHERDELRVMMSHLARGWKINPAQVCAVERKFIIDCGDYTVSAVLDLALIGGSYATIWDYKTVWPLPSQAEYDATFQGRLYAVALVYGRPVTEVECDMCRGIGALDAAKKEAGELRTLGEIPCPNCDGRGHTERLEDPIGSHLQAIRVGEVFPRYLTEDEEVPARYKDLPRIEIDALRHDIESQVGVLAEAFRTGDFPAVSGSHCSECPCEPECPLPKHLRNFAGAITTDEQAKEAAEWFDRVSGKVAATKKELRSYCKGNGPLRYGNDQVLEFALNTRRDTDYEGMESAAHRAARYGEPFNIDEYRRESVGTTFKSRTLSPSELEAE